MASVDTDPQQTLWPAYTGLVLTALFWAGNAVVARGVVGEIPPLALSFWRWCLALLVLAPFGLPRLYRERAVLRAHWRAMLVLSALSVGAFNTLLYLAALTTSALNIALINATMPIIVALLAWLLLRHPVGRRQALGIGLALLGMLAIVAQGRVGNLLGLAFQPGDLIMVAAVSCWGLYSVLIRRQGIAMDPIAFLTAQIALGVPMILPFYLLEIAYEGGFTPTLEMGPVFLYVGIFPGILAYAFWNHGLHRVGPGRAAMFIYLVPVFAAALGYVFLGERLQAYHGAGGLLILAGLWFATRPPAAR